MRLRPGVETDRSVVEARRQRSTGASAPEVRERSARMSRAQPRPTRTTVVAERAGFEPAVLSHTAFRERHHQPLGHLSAGEDRPEPSAGRATSLGQRAGTVSNRAAASSRRMPLTILICRGRDACCASWMTEPAAPSRSSGIANTRASTSLCSSAPMHIAHGSWVAKIVASARRTRPSLRDASRRATMTAWAVGSFVSCDPVVGPSDHRLVDDGDRSDGPLALGQRELRLGQCLAHEQLVVHGSMLADGPLPTDSTPTPVRNHRRCRGRGSMTPHESPNGSPS